jgi:hypothetical protein
MEKMVAQPTLFSTNFPLIFRIQKHQKIGGTYFVRSVAIFKFPPRPGPVWPRSHNGEVPERYQIDDALVTIRMSRHADCGDATRSGANEARVRTHVLSRGALVSGDMPDKFSNSVENLLERVPDDTVAL